MQGWCTYKMLHHRKVCPPRLRRGLSGRIRMHGSGPCWLFSADVMPKSSEGCTMPCGGVTLVRCFILLKTLRQCHGFSRSGKRTVTGTLSYVIVHPEQDTRRHAVLVCVLMDCSTLRRDRSLVGVAFVESELSFCYLLVSIT